MWTFRRAGQTAEIRNASRCGAIVLPARRTMPGSLAPRAGAAFVNRTGQCNL